MEEVAAPVENAGEGAPAPEDGKLVLPDFKATKHKVKIDGKESEVDYDELLNGYQMREVSRKKFEDSAKMRKQAEQFFDAFKKDPFQAAQQLGIDLDSAAENYYAEKLKLEMMDPRERAVLEKERELEQYKKREADYKKNLERQEIAQLQSQALQEIDVEIGDVLKASGTKASPKIVARIAEVMLASLERGERMPATKAYEKTSADLKEEVTTFLGSLPADKLLASLPKETVDAIRKHFVSQVTDDKPFSIRRASAPPTSKASAPAKSTDDYFKRLEQKFNS